MVIGSSFATVMDLWAEGEDVFVGPPSPDRGLRTYGGQVLAQSLRAAQRTVSGDRAVHSTHSYFLKAGDAAEPIELRVDRLRDGRSFSQRQVVALQDGAEVMRSLISFHVPEEGLEWEEPITIDFARPTSEQPYTDYGDVIESVLPVDEHPWPGRGRPMDVSYINAPTAPEGQPVTEPQLMWMRVHDQLGDDRALHDAGLAYLADVGMNPVILLPTATAGETSGSPRPASITPCGSTARPELTNGCTTTNESSPRRAAEDWRAAASTTSTAIASPPACKKA